MRLEDLRAIAIDRFGPECAPMLDRVIEAGANVEGLKMATREARDFDAWRADMEDWIDWLAEGSTP